jgi:hypothetical protein
MYFMLARKLLCTVSGCQRKIYITVAQLSDAKTGQALLVVMLFGLGMTPFFTESFPRASMARANTYTTI